MANVRTNFIFGEWIEASDGRSIEVLCPSDASTIGHISRSGNVDVDQAVNSAHRSLENAGWSRVNPVDRGRLLMRMAGMILGNIDVLASLEASDTGKPMKQARADIMATARYFEFYGGGVDKIHGETIPYLHEYEVKTLREPHGITGHIIPWNYPSQIFGRTVAPALAMGNAVVVKPAEDACLVPIELTRLAQEAGFPPGAINLVTGYGHEAGRALARHPMLDFISFTGSPATGTEIQCAAARNHIGCTLELGGKSPQIVFADADLDAALPAIVNAIVQNSGQTCSAGSRLLVEERVADDILQKLESAFSRIVVGPHDMDCDMGALISHRQMRRVQDYLDTCRPSQVITTGQVADTASEHGYFIPATLLGSLDPADRIVQDEVFGPVLACMTFSDEDDAIALANGTEYGLVSGVWTRDAGRQARIARRLDCGQVFLNCFGAGGGVELPFGGTRKSGHGREKGFEALREFSRIKTVVQYTG